MISYIQRTILVGVVVAIIGAALTLILKVANVINAEQMKLVFERGGLILLILVVVMVVIGVLKSSAK